ncbi:YEATS domain-containing protein 4 isoform X2 [Falco biarmicus]|uniref:YEATS domain-containing protein 4 isoform X2 n=1 Tax=Falco biarmicus TaxID=345155 RepID=UPI0006798AD8|nr:YEATS domain-containing protein 4 isoform X2 [Falco biarmicus]
MKDLKYQPQYGIALFRDRSQACSWKGRTVGCVSSSQVMVQVVSGSSGLDRGLPFLSSSCHFQCSNGRVTPSRKISVKSYSQAPPGVFLSQEGMVTLYHLLKLFQSDTNAILGKKTVVSEFYDEMIFQDPTAMMQQLLTTSRQLTLGAYKHETEFADLEVKTREKLEAAKKKTSFEIAELKERLKASRETINCLKNEIRKLEEDDQSKDM